MLLACVYIWYLLTHLVFLILDQDYDDLKLLHAPVKIFVYFMFDTTLGLYSIKITEVLGRKQLEKQQAGQKRYRLVTTYVESSKAIVDGSKLY